MKPKTKSRIAARPAAPKSTLSLKPLEIHQHVNVAQFHDGGDCAMFAITPRDRADLPLIAGVLANALKIKIRRFDVNGIEQIKTAAPAL